MSSELIHPRSANPPHEDIRTRPIPERGLSAPGPPMQSVSFRICIWPHHTAAAAALPSYWRCRVRHPSVASAWCFPFSLIHCEVMTRLALSIQDDNELDVFKYARCSGEAPVVFGTTIIPSSPSVLTPEGVTRAATAATGPRQSVPVSCGCPRTPLLGEWSKLVLAWIMRAQHCTACSLGRCRQHLCLFRHHNISLSCNATRYSSIAKAPCFGAAMVGKARSSSQPSPSPHGMAPARCYPTLTPPHSVGPQLPVPLPFAPFLGVRAHGRLAVLFDQHCGSLSPCLVLAPPKSHAQPGVRPWCASPVPSSA